ncbi:MAG: helix-turn-helix domain-containing protein [Turicibacter sp.]|nr:helix-turn-helix domain-containing protein [Turicibacter sp.]
MFHLRQRLIYLRKKHGLSQQILADFIWTSRPKIARLESGQLDFSPEIVSKLSEVFKVPRDYFLLVDDSAFIQSQLTELFHLLVTDDLDGVEALLEKKYSHISLEQEVAFKLLESICGIRCQTVDRDEGFEAIFLESIDLKGLSPFLTKVFGLFAYETSAVNNDWLEALGHLDKLIELSNGEEEDGYLVLKRGRCLFRLQKYGLAFSGVVELKKKLEKMNHPLLLARSLILYSALCIHLKLYSECEATLNELDGIVKANHFMSILAVVHQQKGFIKSKTGQFLDALIDYRLAYDIARNDKVKFQILVSIIAASIKLNDYTSAHDNIICARAFASSEKDQMTLDSFKAELALYSGDYKRHKKLFNLVEPYFTNISAFEDLNYIYTYCAKFHAKNHQFKEATKFFLKKEDLPNEKN